MTEVNTSVAEDQEGEALLAGARRESGPSGSPPSSAPEPQQPSTTPIPPPIREGAGGPTPMPNTSTQTPVGWSDMLEELVSNSVIIDGHRTLMGAVIQGVRSVQSRLDTAVQGLLTGFEVSQVIIFSHELDLVLNLGRPYP